MPDQVAVPDPPSELVGRRAEWTMLVRFVRGGQPEATLGLVRGRRRVGKSLLLAHLTRALDGFRYEAVRGVRAEALRELGERVAAHRGFPTPLAFERWEQAVDALLALAHDAERPVVIDEFPYLLEHSPELPSVLQRALGALEAGRQRSRARLILCGSAMSVMGTLLGGTAPLRGRAGLDLRIAPFDFRVARELHGIRDHATAIATWAVIGGVAAYAREMVAGDLPQGPDDFARWVVDRVLSPASPLFNEVPLLLSEDPVTARARKLNLYHGTLAGVATGHHAWSTLTSYLRVRGPSLQPVMDALLDAELIERLADPIRDNRAMYAPADPLIRFHYALMRRHAERLGRLDADAGALWTTLDATFRSQVLGPAFEGMARWWTRHAASERTLGGSPDHVGPSTVIVDRGSARQGEHQLDVVVAADDAPVRSDRTILAIGEAKVGRTVTREHVERLERIRSGLGARASDAKLLLFAPAADAWVLRAARTRADLVFVDFVRLYEGD